MGCKTSKFSTSVHPARGKSARTRATVVHVQESPDAPSSTPEPLTDQHCSSPSQEASLLATELQSKLQDHTNGRKSSAGRVPLLRQVPVVGDDGEEVDGDSSAQDLSPGSTGAAAQSVSATGNSPALSLPIRNSPVQSKPPVPHSPQAQGQTFKFKGFRNVSYRNHCHPTDSQIEFFKMLDKRIEEGPEYLEAANDGVAM